MAEWSSQKVCLFNCDGTYNLDIVEKFLLEVDEKHGLDISTEKLNFCLNSMAELCANTIPRSCTRISSLNQRRERWNWLREDLQSVTGGYRLVWHHRPEVLEGRYISSTWDIRHTGVLFRIVAKASMYRNILYIFHAFPQRKHGASFKITKVKLSLWKRYYSYEVTCLDLVLTWILN